LAFEKVTDSTFCSKFSDITQNLHEALQGCLSSFLELLKVQGVLMAIFGRFHPGMIKEISVYWYRQGKTLRCEIMEVTSVRS
jgi:hypothetical protein